MISVVQFGVSMLINEQYLLLIWIFICTYFLFVSPKYRPIGSLSYLAAAVIILVVADYSFVATVNRCIDVVISCFITFIVLFVFAELLIKFRIKKAFQVYAVLIKYYSQLNCDKASTYII